MAYTAITTAEIAAGKPVCGPTGFGTKVNDNFDYLSGVVGSLSSNQVLNGSFEVDSNADGDPDNWTKNLYAGGTGTLYTTAPAHGAKAWSFTHPGGASNGGGYLESDYIEVSDDLCERWISFVLWATAAGMKNQVIIRYFDKAKADLVAPVTVHSSTTNETTETQYHYLYTPPATARFIKIKLVGGYTDTDVAGTIYFDNIRTGVVSVNEMIGSLAISQAKIKVATSAASAELAQDAYSSQALPGGLYGFYPQVKVSAGEGIFYVGYDITSSTYATVIGLYNKGVATGTLYAQQRYVASSGEVHWIFLLMDKITGKRLAANSAPDHPCFGNRGIVHPFMDYDPAKHEIVVVNPSLDIIKNIELSRFEPDYLKPEMDFIEMFDILYELDEGKQADWPDIPITVALPRIHDGEIVDDWRFMKPGTIINPVKQVIPKPDFITPLNIRLK